MKKIESFVKPAFSLMEMMVVLLIVSIIAAASAPMVTKKLSRDAQTGDNPWVFTNLAGNISYNLKGDNGITAVIGSSRTPNNFVSSRMSINAGADGTTKFPAIAFGRDNNYNGHIYTDDKTFVFGTYYPNQNAGTAPSEFVSIGADQDLAQSAANQSGHVAIGNGVVSKYGDTVTIGRYAKTYGTRSVAVGQAATTGDDTNSAPDSVALGWRARVYGHDDIAIGMDSRASSYNVGNNTNIAIGTRAKAGLNGTSKNIVIGYESSTAPECVGGENVILGHSSDISNLGSTNIIIGNSSHINADYAGHSIVISSGTTAGQNSIVIATQARQIGSQEVIIGDDFHPFRVGEYGVVKAANGRIELNNSGEDGTAAIVIKTENSDDAVEMVKISGNGDANFAGDVNVSGTVEAENFGTKAAAKIQQLARSVLSDIRLKNVGEKYTAGLEELKKLTLYHYTYKSDKEKTPHVGVIAQDLQKVFPDAVKADENGYLMIRWEDMFYAMINSIKELDNKVAEIAQKVKANFDEIAKLKATVAEQQKTIDELKAQNADFEKRLAKLEKKAVKKEK